MEFKFLSIESCKLFWNEALNSGGGIHKLVVIPVSSSPRGLKQIISTISSSEESIESGSSARKVIRYLTKEKGRAISQIYSNIHGWGSYYKHNLDLYLSMPPVLLQVLFLQV